MLTKKEKELRLEIYKIKLEIAQHLLEQFKGLF